MGASLIDEKQATMNDFLTKLENRMKQEESLIALKNSKSYKLNKIKDAKDNARESCTSVIMCKLYRDSLPVSDEYRCAHQTSLNDNCNNFIKNLNNDGVYAYVTDCAKHGCEPAKVLMEAVDSFVESYYKKFYENLDEVDPDEVEMDVNKPDVDESLTKISTKMDYDEISNVIAENVKATVQKEADRTKSDDELMSKIQGDLEQNEQAVTESAIDAELIKYGHHNKVYDPSLFNGIMINKAGKVQEYAESAGLDIEHQQKQAFFEAVQEYTMWEMVSVLNMENMTPNRVRNLAREYAYAK